MPLGWDVVPVERLTRRDELMKCEPYRATFKAELCLKRQAMAADADKPAFRADLKSVGDYGACRGCETGKVVSARLGEAKALTLAEKKKQARGAIPMPKRMAKPKAESARKVSRKSTDDDLSKAIASVGGPDVVIRLCALVVSENSSELVASELAAIRAGIQK